MFPIIAIGTVIGAVASVIKGANWVGDHLLSPREDSTTPPDARPSGFQAALAAQNAGQAVPVTVAPPARVAGSGSVLPLMPQTHDTDYQSLARMRAGLAAYQASDLKRNNIHEKAGQ